MLAAVAADDEMRSLPLPHLFPLFALAGITCAEQPVVTYRYRA